MPRKPRKQTPAAGKKRERKTRKKKQKRGLRKLLIILAQILVFGAIVALFWKDLRGFVESFEGYKISKIEFSGMERMPEGALREAAGVGPGDNIFSAKPRILREQIMTSLVRIEEVYVSRDFARGELSIRILERHPVALVRTPLDGAPFYEADPAGVILGPSTPDETAHLPTFELAPDTSHPEEDTPATGRGFREANALHTAIESSRTLKELGHLTIDASEVSESGGDPLELAPIRAIFGADPPVTVLFHLGKYDEQVADLEKVVRAISGELRRVEVIDLRFGSDYGVAITYNDGEEGPGE
ncbi:cell division protein FtsQ/DivIB [Candidatus Hydrogenedentota bacterium]